MVGGAVIALLVATVVAKAGSATSTLLGSSAASSNSGSPVSFTAIVSGDGSAAPTGKVQFLDGSKVLGTSTLKAKGANQTIAAGRWHTCAVTSGGGVKCWGDNRRGQFGNGTKVGSTAPVDVPGLTRGVVAVVAGERHSCALTDGGVVKCWGDNRYGQLGNGIRSTQPMPPGNVSGLPGGVVAISAGWHHTCAVTRGGAAKCWGYNSYGQLGDGTIAISPTPVGVAGLERGVTTISAGEDHTCAVIDGGARCWGWGVAGQIGDGTVTLRRTTPVAVVGLGRGVATIVAAGSHSCALTIGGQVKCWGDNRMGELGDGTTTSHPTPVGVWSLTSGVVAIATGRLTTCAMEAAGGAKCWGYNGSGQIGDGSKTNRLRPKAIFDPATDIVAMAGGMEHACAVGSDGGVKCWGENGSGELGDGSTTDRLTPVDVPGVSARVVARATFTTSHLGTGLHPITAAYTGDATYAASSSRVLSQRVIGTAAP